MFIVQRLNSNMNKFLFIYHVLYNLTQQYIGPDIISKLVQGLCYFLFYLLLSLLT